MKFNRRNVYISPKAQIGQNVRIGDNTSIYDNVVIEDNTTICNDCVIGEPLPPYYTSPDAYVNPTTQIGAGSFIRSHALIYCDVQLGEGFSSGHRITIRANTTMGKACRVGTMTDIQGECVFGDHCWLHSGIFVAQTTRIGHFVFIYPHVVITDDPTPPSNETRGAKIDNFAQVGAHSLLLPGVHIAEHSLIGAGSLLNVNTKAYGAYIGRPARLVKDVREISNRETGDPHYPWPQRFDRGMPWEGQDFDTWYNNSPYAQD